MTTHSFVPILGKRMRVTQMTESGTVGANKIVTDGFITVTMTPEVEDGAEIILRNASGALCVNERMNNSFKRFNIEAQFCGVNPSLLSFVSNAAEYQDYGGDVAGFTIPEGEITGNFALELWTGLSGALSDTMASGYFLLPFVRKGQVGDITVDGENAVTFTATGMATVGGHAWGVGPYNVLTGAGSPGVASKLPTALDSYDHLLVIDTSVAAPAAAHSPVPVTP